MELLNSRFHIPDSESGQTIIETLAAIFILVTTLTVGLGLAVNVLANAKDNMQEVIAMNIAREGIEQVRMMRDSNWLGGDTAGGVFALQNCTDINLMCYPRTFRQAVNSGPANARNNFNLSTPSPAGGCTINSTNCTSILTIQKDMSQWTISTRNMIQVSNTVNGSYLTNIYLDETSGSFYDYAAPCGNATNCPPSFTRKVTISRVNSAPFSTNANFSNWELVVRVYVTWNSRRCTATLADVDPQYMNTPCKIVLEERLTNWKDYR